MDENKGIIPERKKIPIKENTLEEIIEENKKKKKKKVKKKRKRIFKLIFFSLIIIATIAACILGMKVYKKIEPNLTSAVKKSNQIISVMSDEDFNSRVSTKIYDKNGELIKELKTVDYIYKKYEEINPIVFDAFVAVEDCRFYEHDGLDLTGLLRAIYFTLIKHQTQGGSTITQQLAKNVYLSMEQTVWRKVSEAIIANEIETRYTKHQILEFYVNNINYGNGCYSIESAAKYYFSKNTTELSIAEIALLVGIPNNPTVYNPIKNFDNALKRKDKILKSMKNNNMLTEEEYNEEIMREIKLTVSEKDIDNLVSDYAQSYAVSKTVESLMKYNGFQFKYDFNSEEERKTYFKSYNSAYQEYYSEVISGGYDIYTSIDTEIQNKLQDVVNSQMSKYPEKNSETGIYKKQSAATIIDNKTGLVVGIVGGRTQEDVNNSYNRAYLSARQPGSSIKPLIVYTPAMELGYNANSILVDSAIENGPKNAYSGYKGNVSLRYAVANSINTTAYKLTQEIGIKKALSYLSNMNFKYLSSLDKESATIGLGGFTYGTTTVEMASAYSTLARNGQYIAATNLIKVYDRTSKTVIYENLYETKKIYDDGAAYLMTDVLRTVMTEGTGKAYKLNASEQAGKTGTTNNSRDLWFCGYTPAYSMAVWVGDDTPAAQHGITAHGSIWKTMMNNLNHEGSFVQPDNVFIENNTLKYSKKSSSSITKINENEESERKITEKNNVEKYKLISTQKLSITKDSLAKQYITLFNTYSVTDASQFPKINKYIENADKLMQEIKDETLKAKYEIAKQRLQKEIQELKNEYEKDTTQEQMDEIWNKIKNEFNFEKPVFVEEVQDDLTDDIGQTTDMP